MPPAELNFRVFVSSTFGDFVEEREALQTRVFPQLSAYCLERGVRFQAIDLRWGISQEASVDQQTMNICLQELRRCQQLSPRPNFIVLLGDRYGWRPLPTQIDAPSLDVLRNRMAEEQVAELMRWYRRDDNAVPPEYYLVPRQGEFRNHERWSAIEGRLREILLAALDQALPGDQRRETWRRSATHHEVQHGALAVDDAAEHVLCYFRSIAGLTGDDRFGRYCDWLEGSIDQASTRRLAALKEQLAAKAPEKHIYRWRAQWNGSVLENPLDAFCDRVANDLRKIIDAQISSFESISFWRREQNAHVAFASRCTTDFMGRQAVLEQLEEYARSDDFRPCAVLGAPGMGKTACLARAALHQAEDPSSMVVMRFIGTTPESVNLRTLLSGLWHEIGHLARVDLTIPADVQALIQGFHRLLQQASVKGRVYLYVDGLERLSPEDNAQRLEWLPTLLPDRVKWVVSVVQDEAKAGECLMAVQGRIRPESRIEIGPLSGEEQASLLDKWLYRSERCLQPLQRSAVLEAAGASGSPLYLWLAFQEARHWKSSEAPDGPRSLPTSVAGMLTRLFERLEQRQQHGPEMTSRTLGFLAAARRGLAEDELLDVLSDDHGVMTAFRERSPDSPPVNRLPVIVWSRLFAELEPFLMYRTHQGARLLTIFQSQFAEAVEQRYLEGQTGRKLHRDLATYFRCELDAWDKEAKHSQREARKIDEMPWQLVKAEEWAELTRYLADLAFLNAVFAESSYDARAYWAALQHRAKVLPTVVYRQHLASPEKAGEGLWGVLMLLEYNGFPMEALEVWDRLLDHYESVGDRERQQACFVAMAQLLVDRDAAAAERLLIRAQAVEERRGTETDKKTGRSSLLDIQIRAIMRALSNPNSDALVKQWYEPYRFFLSCLPLSVSCRLPRRTKVTGLLGLLAERGRLCRELNDRSGLASVQFHRAQLQFHEFFDAAAAASCLEEAERLFGELGDEEGVQACRSSRAGVLFGQGRAQDAIELEARSERAFRESGNQLMLAQSLVAQARFLLDSGGNREIAQQKCEEALGIFMEMESDRMIRAKILLTRIQFGLTSRKCIVAIVGFLCFSQIYLWRAKGDIRYVAPYGVVLGILLLFLFLGTFVFYGTRGVAQQVIAKRGKVGAASRGRVNGKENEL